MCKSNNNVSDGNVKVSVCIPTFNCAASAELTLRSVVNQQTGRFSLEIIVCDDCSKDSINEVVARFSDVTLVKSPINLGIGHNFNRCVQVATGDYIHILHGDDLVNHSFYREIAEAILANRDVGTFVSATTLIDEVGCIVDSGDNSARGDMSNFFLSNILYENPIFTPSVVIDRSVYSNVGLFDTELSHLTDWHMWIRSISFSGVLHVPNAMAFYRMYSANDTAKCIKSASNVRERLLIRKWLRCKGFVFDSQRFDLVTFHQALNQYKEFLAKRQIKYAQNNLLEAFNVIGLLPMKLRCTAVSLILKSTIRGFLFPARPKIFT